MPRRLPHGGVAEGGFLIRGLQLEDNGPQAVVATTNGHAGLANPVSVVEQPLPRAVGQGEGVLIVGIDTKNELFCVKNDAF